jgi:SNF2 family DNA or RNA helicase
METLSFLAERKRAFDNSDPGIGKTASQVVHYAQRKQPRGKCLVLCPKTLMVSAWLNDFETFAPGVTVSLAFASQREEAFAAGTDVVIMNIDGVKWLADNPKLLFPFDHLIVDEYTACKHANSQRSKALNKIKKHFDYRYLLSGTPNPNSVMELWHPALICDDGKALGTSYTRLRNTIQTPIQIGPGANHIRWEDKPGATQAVHTLLAPITIRHAFEDVMKHVPPNFQEYKSFELSPKARKLYDKMENDCILAMDDATITAVHAASLRTKLLQIASGAVYDGNGGYQLIDTQRYELIADLIDETPHSVVFFNWKHQRDQLCKEFEARGYSFAVIDGNVDQRERDRIVADYQAGKYKTVLLHPRTGAHGLTLTRGTLTVFSSPIYEADLMAQGIKRIHRGTQDKPTRTVFVEAKNTVERLVFERLNDKNGRMIDLLEMMKYRRKK